MDPAQRGRVAAESLVLPTSHTDATTERAEVCQTIVQPRRSVLQTDRSSATMDNVPDTFARVLVAFSAMRVPDDLCGVQMDLVLHRWPHALQDKALVVQSERLAARTARVDRSNLTVRPQPVQWLFPSSVIRVIVP